MCFEYSATAYQQALHLLTQSSSSSSTPRRLSDCRFGLAETLQSWAQTLLSIAATAPDAQLTFEYETHFAAQACTLFKQSVENYFLVRKEEGDEGSIRVDALVNAGNALSSWAETLTAEYSATKQLARQQEAVQLLLQAEQCCATALEAEEDGATLSNLGDIYIQHGELCCELLLHAQQQHDANNNECHFYFTKAEEAYRQACSLSSSELGDDVPGLLCNWGAGLVTAVSHTCAQPQETASLRGGQMIDHAISLLRQSMSFDRGDPTPCLSLGEALVAKAEWLLTTHRRSAGGSAPSARALEEAYGCLQGALEEGYGGALKIQASLTDGMIGMAETHAKIVEVLNEGRGTDISTAANILQHWTWAAKYYEQALVHPEKLGTRMQRSNVRYNYACSLVGCNRMEEAVAMVRNLIAAGTVSIGDILGDADLHSIAPYFSSPS